MPWRNSTYEFNSSFAQSLLFSSTVTSTAANETLRHDISKKNRYLCTEHSAISPNKTSRISVVSAEYGLKEIRLQELMRLSA